MGASTGDVVVVIVVAIDAATLLAAGALAYVPDPGSSTGDVFAVLGPVPVPVPPKETPERRRPLGEPVPSSEGDVWIGRYWLYVLGP